MIRKGTKADLEKVIAIYDEILTGEENGLTTIGWKRGMYPTPEVAEGGLERGELFVIEDNGEIVGSMILNKKQDDEYALGTWQYDAKEDEVMVLHTFTVSPSHAKKGYGTKLFEFYENYARDNGCKYLRFSTRGTNSTARSFYKKQGVSEACVFQRQIRGSIVDSVFLEKKL